MRLDLWAVLGLFLMGCSAATVIAAGAIVSDYLSSDEKAPITPVSCEWRRSNT